MRILYACRAFSGLLTSLQSERWTPTGVPTIYKVIEALDQRNGTLTLVVTDRDDELAAIGVRHRASVRLQGLETKPSIWRAPKLIRRLPARLRPTLSEIALAVRLFLKARRERPDVLYVDRANLIAGALTARFTDVSVVLRIMGNYPSMWRIAEGWRPMLVLYRWALRSRFAHVIFTQDGAPGQAFMDRILAADVPNTMMLNGVDAPTASDLVERSDEKDCAGADRWSGRSFTLLFVGRMVDNKGPETFVRAVIELRRRGVTDLRCRIVGTGQLEGELRDLLTRHDAWADVEWSSSLPHREIAEEQRRSDVYVSLNRLGNLSNANLECMALGVCMVTPPSRPDDGTDVDTDRLFPQDTILRLPKTVTLEEEVTALADTLESLARDPDEVRRRAARTRAVAADLLTSWPQRVSAEIDLLQEIATASERSCAERKK